MHDIGYFANIRYVNVFWLMLVDCRYMHTFSSGWGDCYTCNHRFILSMINKDNMWSKDLERLEFSIKTWGGAVAFSFNLLDTQDLIFGPYSEAEGGSNVPNAVVANCHYKPKRSCFFPRKSGTSCQWTCFPSVQQLCCSQCFLQSLIRFISGCCQHFKAFISQYQ